MTTGEGAPEQIDNSPGSESHAHTPALKLHRLTRGLSDLEILRIAQASDYVSFSEGECVHEFDTPVEAVLLVVHGRLRLSVLLESGEEQTILYLHRDEAFGLLALTQPGADFPVRVTVEQEVDAISMPISAAVQLVRDIPMFGRNLLSTLGPRMRETFVGKASQRRPRVIGFVYASEAHRSLTAAICDRLTELGETIGIASDRLETQQFDSEHLISHTDADGQVRPAHEIRKDMSRWPELDRYVIETSWDVATGDLRILVDACGFVCWVMSPQDAAQAAERMRSVAQDSTGVGDKSHVIFMLDSTQPLAPCAAELRDLIDRDFKIHTDGFGDAFQCSRQAGIERVVHALRGVSIGIALGGGAARGMAHLGVLQVLDDAGITIDRMSGTSAGALTGILYAAGFTPGYLTEAFAHDLEPAWYQRMLPRGDSWFMLGKYRRGGWDGMLRKYIKDWRLEQLPLPFSAVTVDLVLATQVVRSYGDAVEALLESINLPVMARPICRDGMALVDGGILNVLPADVLVSQNANFVIAVDVASKIPFHFAGNDSNTPTDKMRVPRTTETLLRLRIVQDRNLRSLGSEAADLVISPDVTNVGLADFVHASNTATLGRDAAQDALPELKKLLRRLDRPLFD